MVAAWIRAETGVGPSIASGSQVWSGTCADLAKAPTSSRIPISTTTPSLVVNSSGARLEDPQQVEGAELAEQEQRREHEPDVADDVDHERLHAGGRRGGPPVPEADQRVGGEADEGPADDQQHQVPGQDQQQHREDEEVEVAEEAVEAPIAGHVADRVEVDHGADPAHDQAHVDRQRVDQDVHLDVEAAGRGVVVERVGELALLGGQVEQLGAASRSRRRRRARSRRCRSSPRCGRAGRGSRARSAGCPRAGRRAPASRRWSAPPGQPLRVRSSSTLSGIRRR